MIGSDQNFVTFGQNDFPLLTNRPAFRLVKRQKAFFAQRIERVDALGVGPDDLEPITSAASSLYALDKSNYLAGFIFGKIASLSRRPLLIIHDLHLDVIALQQTAVTP